MFICEKCKSIFKRQSGLHEHENFCIYDEKIINEIVKAYKIEKLSFNELGRKFPKSLTRHAIIQIKQQNIQRTQSEISKIAHKRYSQSFILTDKQRQQRSINMSNYLKTTRNHPWKNKKESFPAKIMREWLERNSKYKIYREYTPEDFEKNYRIDLAIIDLKIAIEVNGNSHYENGCFTKYHIERQKYIELKGWKVINIYAGLIVSDFQKVEEILNQYFETGENEILNVIEDYQNEKIKMIEQKYGNQIREYFLNNISLIEITRKINISFKDLRYFLSKNNLKRKRIKATNKRDKQKMLKLIKDIDFSTFGWVGKVAKIWNISHPHISRIMKQDFPEIFEKAFHTCRIK
jgi:very-short-patch-repair endonuclease